MKKLALLLIAAGLFGCAVAPAPVAPGDSAVTALLPARTLSVSIAATPQRVYDFVANPENLPQWARGLGKSVKKSGEAWLVDTPQGPVTVRFAERNRFGVLDHYVTTPQGVVVYVPLRVIANGPGSELLFTLFRQPGMSDEQYAADRQLVEQDLRTLKKLLEQ